MTKAEKQKVEEVVLILERICNLDGRENVAAVRHDLIEADRILWDLLE